MFHWKRRNVLELYSRMFMNVHDKTRVSFRFQQLIHSSFLHNFKKIYIVLDRGFFKPVSYEKTCIYTEILKDRMASHLYCTTIAL